MKAFAEIRNTPTQTKPYILARTNEEGELWYWGSFATRLEAQHSITGENMVILEVQK